MCGIAAIINSPPLDSNIILGDMASAIQSRGLSRYYWENENKTLKVSYIHLPIVSEQGDPGPHTSENITTWLNGYISNWKELAKKYRYKVTSDAQLVPKLIRRFGKKKCEEMFNGFYAILIYDSKTAYTYTMCDRYGIKTLYQYRSPKGVLYICSEPKGILKAQENWNIRDPKVPLERAAIQAFLQTRERKEPLSNLAVKPARWPINEKVKRDWLYSLGVMTVEKETIWQGIERTNPLNFNWLKRAISKPFQGNYTQAKAKFTKLLQKSFQRNFDAKYKACFLSGGIDSGVISQHMGDGFRFSVDYTNKAHSEHDNLMLNSSGQHVVMVCNPEMAIFAGRAIEALDDPRAGSCYTNFYITRLAHLLRQKVLISGAGGDEIMGGYPHRRKKKINEVIKRTNKSGPKYKLSHREYDWRYLACILVVEDRMAGAHQIETRYPYLDNELVDFCLSLPARWVEGKQILLQTLGKHLPPEVKYGKKRGFTNPYFTNDSWTEFALNEIMLRYHGV